MKIAEATTVMGLEDVVQVCERNISYDADQYKLEKLQDQTFQSIQFMNAMMTLLKIGRTNGEGGASREEVEPVSRYIDGTGRLNNGNILGEGPAESEPWGVENGHINSPPIRDDIRSGRCRV